jgi:TIR domain
MTRIFISYRRHDAQAAAALLHQRLTYLLPQATIFIDVTSLVAADDWRSQLEQAVRSADWCVVLIGRNWLERNPDGTSRLGDRSDVVRIEVSTALAAGIATLPILVDGAPMPSADLLPLNVMALTRIQCETVSTTTFDDDVRRICEVLVDGPPVEPRKPFPPELVGFWENTTPRSRGSAKLDDLE